MSFNKKENFMKPGIYHMIYKHDNNCPTLFSRDLKDCKCKPEVQIVKNESDEQSVDLMMKDMKEYKKTKAKYN
jgi:hypothetical protein